MSKHKIILSTLVFFLVFSSNVLANEDDFEAEIMIQSESRTRGDVEYEDSDQNDEDNVERGSEEEAQTRPIRIDTEQSLEAEGRIEARDIRVNESDVEMPARSEDAMPARPAETDSSVSRDRDSEDDEIEPKAKNYNSTRSNRRKNIFDNQDDLPEVAIRNGVFVSVEGDSESEDEDDVSAEVRRDNSLYCWGRAEDETGEEFKWGRGLCVAINVIPEDNVEARSRIDALQLRADDIRAWSEEERNNWNEFRQRSRGEAEEVIGSIIDRIESDQRIREVRTGAGAAEVRYHARMRLLGFIPVEREVRATVDAEGRTRIEYPWYRFLSSRPDTGAINNLLNLLRS